MAGRGNGGAGGNANATATGHISNGDYQITAKAYGGNGGNGGDTVGTIGGRGVMAATVEQRPERLRVLRLVFFSRHPSRSQRRAAQAVTRPVSVSPPAAEARQPFCRPAEVSTPSAR